MKGAIRFAYLLAMLAAVACSPRSGEPGTPSRPGDSADANGHVEATRFTSEANAAVGGALSLADQADFDAASKGFVAKDDPLVVETRDGRVVWNAPAYAFVDGDAPFSVNPSLWRQAKLNGIYGLFKVTDDIYQVRGYDISNMSVIESPNGRILVDPLTSTETAAAALALVNRSLGERPILAVVFTHSHVDHFGGIAAVVDAEAVRSGKTLVIAPSGFMKEALSENVLAGAVMGRRAQYMYGNNLSRDARGHVDTGLGKAPAVGGLSIVAPTVSIDHTGQELDVDGVRFVFQYVPDSEAPAELTFFLPRLKAFCGAEIVSHTLHNLYTLRGAKVRDASKWSGYIDEAIDLFGGDTEVVFNSHHWPVWGNAQVLDYLKKQRDMYAFIHDQTLHLASAGLTPRQIAETIRLPASLENTFADRGYYGTLKHNAKAVYQFYFGWFDGNPANLDPLPPPELGKRYVDAIGGPAKVLAVAQAAYDTGDYRWAATLLDNLVFAEPQDSAAKELLARTYDQLGYRAESGPWRDFYLTGAQELRHGVDSASPGLGGLLASVPIESILAAMATQIDGAAADGKHIMVNVTFTDLQRSFVLELDNSVLHHKEMQPAKNADVTVRLTKAFWLSFLSKQASVKDLVFSDALDIDGDRLALVSLLKLVQPATPGFPIVTPASTAQ
ncbi:MAG TPA: alkyl sulfatase dimerization domain-containing protein [Pseudomonadales bacterium]|nr:alkyl sulfatase dimerization domain-containing protein [Pseudomonadales bacterium]